MHQHPSPPRDRKEQTTTNSRSSLLGGVRLITLGLAFLQSSSPGLWAQEVAADATASYVIGVGDVLRVSVWKNEELSARAPVRPDGRISVPLAGEIEVAGRTPAQVRADLTTAFSEFVTAPAVSLVIEEISSRRVFVVGEVSQSGVYDILQPTKLMQVLAMAGGLTEYAKKDQVIVLRDRGGRDQRILVSIKAIQSGRRPEDNILLQPGDTVIVP